MFIFSHKFAESIFSVVRKENAACPDNFMVCVKLDDGSSIYEANGKFSIKKLVK